VASILVDFLKQRAALVVAMLGFTAGLAQHAAAIPPASVPALCGLLAQASSSQVGPDDVGWEPSRGAVRDALFGRGVLFRGQQGPGKPGDIFRADVRVTPQGKLLSVGAVYNLTHTPLGDEVALAVSGERAVFASVAYEAVQGITVLDFGARPERLWSGLNGGLLQLRSWLETGRFRQRVRHQIHLLGTEPRELRLSPTSLELLADARPEPIRFALVDGGVVPAVETDDVIVTRSPIGSESWLQTSVDLVRHVLGPVPISWLEHVAFGWFDELRRKHYALTHSSDPRPTPAHPIATVADSTLQFAWPPPKVLPLLNPTLAGEGEWQPGGFEREAADSPLFYQTFVRADADRPYARVVLIALDMRRLELRMEAGYDEPRPQMGPPGPGALPKDKPTIERVVATFNGAFKSIHGDYGMMVDKRVLVPPEPEAATVLVRDDTRAGLGDWGPTPEIDGSIRYFRQNLDALIADGKVNPKGRKQWGMRLLVGSALTERSALCRRADGHWLYAWGKDLTAMTLAQVLKHAECDYAMHLDMNPGHVGFVYASDLGQGPTRMRAKLAHSEMTLPPERHALWSDQDFFYLLKRRPAADQLAALNPTLSWLPSPGLNPAPENWPAILQTTSTIADVQVQIYSVQPGRLRFEMTGGTLEPLPVGAPSPHRSLSPALRAEVALGIPLGHSTLATRFGLVSAGETALSLRRPYATLVVATDGTLRVEPSGAVPTLAAGESAVQLPELVRDGEATQKLTERGEFALRGALCVHPAGNVLVALVEHDASQPIGVELTRLGCRNVLLLDRGSKHAAEVRRGPGEALGDVSEVSWLYGLVQAMQPLTIRP
jgi:hypothetical protein